MRRLRTIAHARAGDKGDTSQISLIAFDPENFGLLERKVTIEVFLAQLPGLAPSSVQRFELPGLGALNFVVQGALGGGVTRSLALDAHGKTLAAQLLDMEIGDD